MEKLPALRKRLTQVQMEEHASLASMVCWLGDACLNEMPAQAQEVKDLKKAFVQGDHTLLLDMLGLLHDSNTNMFLVGLHNAPRGTQSPHCGVGGTCGWEDNQSSRCHPIGEG